jgi:outer membrane protein assembly factor BamB
MVAAMPIPSLIRRRIAAFLLMSAAAAGISAAQTARVPPWPLAEAARLTYEGEINRRAVADGPRIYFTTRRGWIYAVNTERRTVDWRFGADQPIFRPPAVAGSLIAAVDEGRTVYCLKADGLLNWSYRAEGPAAADPLWLGPRLIVALRSGPVIALNAEHPGEIWRTEFDKDLVRATAVWNGRVLCACRDGWIRLLDAEGRPAGAWDCGGPLAGPLTVDKDLVFAGREDGFFCAVDVRDGSTAWRIRIGGEPAALAAVDGRRLYLTSGNGVLFALSRGGGEIIWWRPLPSRLVFGPILWRDRVVAAAASKVLSSFTPRTGRPAGEFQGAADWKADPLERNGFLLLHNYDPDSREGTLLFLEWPIPAPAKTGAPSKGAQSP